MCRLLKQRKREHESNNTAGRILVMHVCLFVTDAHRQTDRPADIITQNKSLERRIDKTQDCTITKSAIGQHNYLAV